MHENIGLPYLHDRTTLAGMPGWVVPVLAVAGAALSAAGFVVGLSRGDHLAWFLHAYLTNYVFFLSISLGALFFTILHHATRAGWSVAVRRLLEILAANMPILAVLFLPLLAAVLLRNPALYPWVDPNATGQSEGIAHKSGYLNATFFTLRALAYLAVWWLLARYYVGRSYRQDRSGDPALTIGMERFSGPALILLAFSVTFAAFDWLMSLDPEWLSTIYGVYFFSGTTLGALAAVILMAVLLQAGGRLTSAITAEHYHDLGKLLFAMIVFWGYIAFSQYMLIWYGNVPEETHWYLARQTGAWTPVSLGLLFGQLLIPFVGMLSREAKRRKRILYFWAVWILAFHWLDMYWLVAPSLEGPGLPFGPIDLCLLAGLGCLYLAGLLRTARQGQLLPVRDPRLGESLAFENA
jgi:hypothetical protein